MITFYHLLVSNTFAGVMNFTVWFAITFFVFLQTKSVFATAIIVGLYLVLTAVSGFWFGTGPDRGIALVFVITGVIGLCVTLFAMHTKYYKQLSQTYLSNKSA